jgi:signal transduction histidine kinase
VPQSPGLAQLVSLACHDIRTPLATVAGFANTLARDEGLGEQQARYIGMIEAAAAQLGELVDLLALVARIESNRYDPLLETTDTLRLARDAAERVDRDRAVSAGEGAMVEVELQATVRALAALARAALRHGSLDRVELVAAEAEVSIAPVRPQAAPIVLAEDLRDLGAAVGLRLLHALGCTVRLDGEQLHISFPVRRASAAAATGDGP